MISTTPTLLFFVIAGVSSVPYLVSDDSLSRRSRSAGYNSGSSANAGASAFSSSSTSVIPGPGGSGSFNAKSGISHFPSPNFYRNSDTYAGNFGYGKNDFGNYLIPNRPSSNSGSSHFGGGGGGSGLSGFGGGGGGGGQSGFGSPGFNSGFGSPAGFGGSYGGYGSGFGGYGSGGGFGGYREGGTSSGFGGSSSNAGAGSFASAGSGGFGSGGFSGGPSGSFASSGGFPSNFGPSGFTFPPFMPFDFASFMQQYFANAAAHEEFIRKQAQAHGSDGSSNDVGGVGANAFGQIGPQGGYGAASVHPAPPDGIDERFGGGDRGSSPNSGPVSSVSGSFPPPQGSFQGVSTFSASGQSDVNGKKTSYKTSSVSVNDNGKVTTYTAHDP